MNLTAEQLQVIKHPVGKHAKVVAVAGSGKTTALVYRVKCLIDDHQNQDPLKICVLMFNRLAHRQFKEKLGKLDQALEQGVVVNTFHSFAYKLVKNNEWDWQSNDEEDVQRNNECLDLLLDEIARTRNLVFDNEVARRLIGLWKGELINPQTATCNRNDANIYREVYEAFEQLRCQRRLINYDDLVPQAVSYIENARTAERRLPNNARFKFIIVDEYQDVNYGQERLIELLAAEGADVMVVGDDDQTIYEWRGSRPDFILNRFDQVFTNKEITQYKLTRSHRFGPELATAAANCIAHNNNRITKNVVADDSSKQTTITCFNDADDVMVERIRQYSQEPGRPDRIIVLGRKNQQLDAIKRNMTNQNIPFYEEGRELRPYEWTETRCLLDVLHMAINFDQTLEHLARMMRTKMDSLISSLAKLFPEVRIEEAFRGVVENAQTINNCLQEYSNVTNSDEVRNMLRIMTTAYEWRDRRAAALQRWLVQRTKYKKTLERFYKNEQLESRLSHVDQLIRYIGYLDQTINVFFEYINRCDTTRGRSHDELIRLATIHKTKGLEYDYVFLPKCINANMPGNAYPSLRVFRNGCEHDMPPPPPAIESERRLFYVALTRTIKGIFIGVNDNAQEERHRTSCFVGEMQLEGIGVSP